MKPHISLAVQCVKAQFGLPYVFGYEESPTDPTPEAFDCSELMQYVDGRVGPGSMPDGSMNQRAYCQAQGTMISVAKALVTPGAIFFRDINVTGTGHVAVSMGDGTTGEARGSAYGVGRFTADPKLRLWTEAALWPGFDYTKKEPPLDLVKRWVLFGPYGGRHDGKARLEDLLPAIKAFNEKRPHRPALIVRRDEPRDLDKLTKLSYPAWLAKKYPNKEDD